MGSMPSIMRSLVKVSESYVLNFCKPLFIMHFVSLLVVAAPSSGRQVKLVVSQIHVS